MGKYFGTDGFRGEAGITLTADHWLHCGLCGRTQPLHGLSDLSGYLFLQRCQGRPGLRQRQLLEYR